MNIMGKKAREKKEGNEVRDFSLSVKGKFTTRDGVKEITELNMEGTNVIITAVILSILKKICQDSNVKYTEFLSETIKQEVRKEFFEEMKEKQENEK